MEGSAVDLRDYLRILRRGWPIVLAFVALGLAAGIAITVSTTKIYQASTQLFVSAQGTTDATQAAQGATYAQDTVQSLVNVVDSQSVLADPSAKARNTLLARLNKQFKTDYTLAELQSKVSASAPLNKTLITISASDHNPVLASWLANNVAAKFTNYVTGTLSQIDPQTGKPLISVTPYQGAQVPGAPIKPNKVLDIALGFVLGLLLGIGVVILRDVLDTTVKGPGDFEALDLAVLGMVPLDKRTIKQPISFRADPHSARSEAYRQLRTNLQFVNVDDAPRIIAVTSAIPGEGKTTTAMNLAAAMADAGHRVILVEADLRRPNIAKTLGLVSEVGFTSVLIGQTTLLDALQNVARNFAVLTCGPVPPNPSELLVSAQAKQLLRSVADHADFVIVDTAPLLPVADGSEIAVIADATILVHRAGKTTRDQAARCVTALEKVGERPVGVVLNMISRSSGRYDYEYAYTYTYRPDRSHSGDSTAATQQLPAVNGHAPSSNGHAAADSPASVAMFGDVAPAQGPVDEELPTHGAVEAPRPAPSHERSDESETS
jgi:succinoglycan biosynthesis transport protein ExoP